MSLCINFKLNKKLIALTPNLNCDGRSRETQPALGYDGQFLGYPGREDQAVHRLRYGLGAAHGVGHNRPSQRDRHAGAAGGHASQRAGSGRGDDGGAGSTALSETSVIVLHHPRIISMAVETQSSRVEDQ